MSTDETVSAKDFDAHEAHAAMEPKKHEKARPRAWKFSQFGRAREERRQSLAKLQESLDDWYQHLQELSRHLKEEVALLHEYRDALQQQQKAIDDQRLEMLRNPDFINVGGLQPGEHRYVGEYVVMDFVEYSKLMKENPPQSYDHDTRGPG